MTTLSAVRAFVGGEGLWSKAQKTAVYNLQLYAMTREESYYRLFFEELTVPLGDRKARAELMKPNPDLAVIEAGFREGQNHLNDIVPMTNLVRRFYKVPHLARAIEKWEEGDQLLSELIVLAERLHAEDLKRSKTSERSIDGIVSEIMVLDQKLTDAENQFSSRLGEASRWLEGLLMVLLILAVRFCER